MVVIPTILSGLPAFSVDRYRDPYTSRYYFSSPIGDKKSLDVTLLFFNEQVVTTLILIRRQVRRNRNDKESSSC